MSQSFLPTWVIDVGTAETKLSLHASSGESARYVALSYCWGKDTPLSTTNSTLEDRKRSIAFESLPKTYQDAVIITRKLGVRYLWIDSLCILQDSQEDWSRESAKMRSIYANSFVAIAADSATDCRDGFLRSAQGKHTSISIQCRNPAGIDCHVFARTPMYRAEYWGEVAHSDVPPSAIWAPEPSSWNSRAWTLQERLLAPRILHYSYTEFAWECRTQLCCECQLEPETLDIDGEHSISYRSRFLGARFVPSLYPAFSEVSSIKRWSETVQEFSSRHLTRNSDRLHALSGLAALIKSESQDEYLCGLWRKNLARDLLWCVFDETYIGGTTDLSRRHDTYYAPSWSWASIVGPVSCFSEPETIQDEIVMEICDARCTLASLDPYGPAVDGAITARGFLAPVWAAEPSSMSSSIKVQFYGDTNSRQGPYVYLGDAELDIVHKDSSHPEVVVGDRLFFLPVLRFAQSIQFTGLLLKPFKQDASQFCRVGCVQDIRDVAFAVWCETARKQTIVIV